jgi:hypothetical protein
VIETDMEQLAMEQYNISTILMYQRIMAYRQQKPLNSHYYRSDSSEALGIAACSSPEMSSVIQMDNAVEDLDEEGIFTIDF